MKKIRRKLTKADNTIQAYNTCVCSMVACSCGFYCNCDAYCVGDVSIAGTAFQLINNDNFGIVYSGNHGETDGNRN